MSKTLKTVNELGAEAAGVPEYKCHKKVRAAEILAATPLSPHENIGFSLALKGVKSAYDVTWDWYVKHSVQIGGYLVFYKDGYVSFSPADAFEEGYALS